jgi:hypothetical protein
MRARVYLKSSHQDHGRLVVALFGALMFLFRVHRRNVTALASLRQYLPSIIEPHVADRKGLGNIAGPIGNNEMFNSGADLCIALHHSIAKGKGTKNSICRAQCRDSDVIDFG